jgi:hypothetical protein
MSDLFQRGINNIKDARFIREQITQVAKDNERWNIVVHQSYQVVELLIKGMICLTKNKPHHDHKIEVLIDQLLNILTQKPANSFTPIAVISPNGFYGLWLTGNNIHVGKFINGTYTELGNNPINFEIKADNLLQMRLIIESNSILLKSGTEIVWAHSDSSLTGSFQMEWNITQTPTAQQVDRLKEIGKKLKASREKAFYTEQIFAEDDASKAIDLMNEVNTLLAYFLIEPVL